MGFIVIVCGDSNYFILFYFYFVGFLLSMLVVVAVSTKQPYLYAWPFVLWGWWLPGVVVL